jgi:hypothetical protein
MRRLTPVQNQIQQARLRHAHTGSETGETPYRTKKVFLLPRSLPFEAWPASLHRYLSWLINAFDPRLITTEPCTRDRLTLDRMYIELT